MTSSNPSDPRLLLPEWLRDGDIPAVAVAEPKAAQPETVDAVEQRTDVIIAAEPPARAMPLEPFSERLSVDTKLDPAQLVSASDLPAWLGGLDHDEPSASVQHLQAAPASVVQVVVEEPEPYVGADAPQDGVIDIEVNGWMLAAAALGLLIMLAAALRLYLT